MSEIITDKLTGKTAAGNITITSEGGAATQSLQQGLVKSFVRYNGSGNSINSSLNHSSLTDNGTGDHTVTLTNAMLDADYATAGQCGYGNDNLANVSIPNDDYAVTSTTFRCQTFYANTSNVDMGYVNVSTLGDLA